MYGSGPLAGPSVDTRCMSQLGKSYMGIFETAGAVRPVRCDSV